MMRNLGTVVISPTPSQQPQISQYISLTKQYWDSYKVKYVNALTTGFDKGVIHPSNNPYVSQAGCNSE